MNSSDERLDNLFRSAKEAPPELDVERVESIISSFDTLEVKPDSSGANFFNIMSVLIIGFSIIMLLLAYLYYNSGISEPEAIVQSNGGAVKRTSSLPNSMRLQEVKEEQLKVQADQIGTVVSSVALENTNEPPVLLSPKKVAIPNVPQREELRETQALSESTLQSTTTLEVAKPSQQPAAVQGTPLPTLSDEQLKDLKTRLLGRLYADRVVSSDVTKIYLQLNGTYITVNDIRLEDDLTPAYTKLTSIVGYGEHRVVKISPDQIFVGDLIDGEFEGSALRLFPSTSISPAKIVESGIPEKPAEDQADNATGIGEEWNILNDFAEKVLAKAPLQQGKKRLVSVDLSAAEMSLLYEMLQNQLRKDRLISSSSDYVILGLGDRAITFNGKELTPDKFLTYRAILKVHNIKHGARRIVCMNDKVMGVGDIKPREFKGTIWSVAK